MISETEFLQSIREIVENNLSNTTINGEYIGRAIGMSRMQIHRKLRLILNQSTSEYVKNIRLENAMELLKDRRTNVSEASYIVGFSSPNLFSKAFKQKFGITPSQVLKSENDE